MFFIFVRLALCFSRWSPHKRKVGKADVPSTTWTSCSVSCWPERVWGHGAIRSLGYTEVLPPKDAIPCGGRPAAVLSCLRASRNVAFVRRGELSVRVEEAVLSLLMHLQVSWCRHPEWELGRDRGGCSFVWRRGQRKEGAWVAQAGANSVCVAPSCVSREKMRRLSRLSLFCPSPLFWLLF